MNDEFEIAEEAVAAYIKAMPQQFADATEENYETHIRITGLRAESHTRLPNKYEGRVLVITPRHLANAGYAKSVYEPVLYLHKATRQPKIGWKEKHNTLASN